MARSSPGPDIATSEFGRDCLCWPGTGGRVRPSSTAHLSLLRASVRHTEASSTRLRASVDVTDARLRPTELTCRGGR
jgi:hypothetical protein